MENYDGSVIINTGLDLHNLEKDAEMLRKAIGEATKGAKALQDVAKESGVAQITMLKQANMEWESQLNLVRELRNLLLSMPAIPQSRARQAATGAPRSVAQDEYERLKAEADALDKQLERLTEKSDKLIALHGQEKATGMTAFKSLQYDIDRVIERYEELQARMREIEAERAQMASMVENEPTLQEAPQLSPETAKENIEPVRKEVEKMAQAYTVLATQMRRAKTEAVKTTKEVHHRSKLSLGNILKYAFGIRSLFFLMRRLRAVAKESLGLIAQADPTFNSAVSKMLTGVKQLKADMGTVLQPLIQAATPAFTYILDKAHTITKELAKFFAAVVGQDYIDVATVKNVDYANSVRDVKDATDQALGSYDKLNVIGKTSKDTENTLALTKETVKYTKEALDNNSWTVRLGRRLKELFDWVGKKFGEFKDWLEKQPWISKITENLKKLLADPDGFLALIGATLVVTKLTGMISKAVSGGVSGGLTLGMIGKSLAVGVTAVVGFKIGNKIFDSLPDELKDELGAATAYFLEHPITAVFKGAGEAWEAVKKSLPTWIYDTNAEGDPTGDFENSLNGIMKATGRFQEQFRQAWQNFKVKFNVGFEQKYDKTPTQALSEISNKIKEAINNPKNPVKQAVDIVKGSLKTMWSQIFPDSKTTNFGLGEKMKSLGEKITNTWKTDKKLVWKELVGIKNELAELLGDAWTGAFEDVFNDDGSKKYGGAAVGKLGKIVSYSSGLKGAAQQVENSLNNNFGIAGKDAAEKLISGFNTTINGDTSMTKTLTQKITAAIAASYATASVVFSALYSPLLSGRVTPSQAGKTATATTTVAGDIVLKLDGKEVSRVVWDNTKQQYKQTGKNLLLSI